MDQQYSWLYPIDIDTVVVYSYTNEERDTGTGPIPHTQPKESGTMMTSAYQVAHFIHEHNVAIAIWHEEPLTPADGWDFTLDYPVLEIVQYPALPFLCQSTIDDMDQDAEEAQDDEFEFAYEGMSFTYRYS